MCRVSDRVVLMILDVAYKATHQWQKDALRYVRWRFRVTGSFSRYGVVFWHGVVFIPRWRFRANAPFELKLSNMWTGNVVNVLCRTYR